MFIRKSGQRRWTIVRNLYRSDRIHAITIGNRIWKRAAIDFARLPRLQGQRRIVTSDQEQSRVRDTGHAQRLQKRRTHIQPGRHCGHRNVVHALHLSSGKHVNNQKRHDNSVKSRRPRDVNTRDVFSTCARRKYCRCKFFYSTFYSRFSLYRYRSIWFCTFYRGDNDFFSLRFNSIFKWQSRSNV